MRLTAGDFAKAIEIAFIIMIKHIMFGFKKKKSNNIIYVETDTDDIETNALKILEAARKIVW